MNLRFRITISVLFLAAGLLLGSVPFLHRWSAPAALVMGAATQTPTPTPASQSQAESQPASGNPVRIVIASLGIDLPVIDGYYTEADQSWTLSGDKAQFATISQPANNLEGNTFIYGHNNKKVFSALPSIQPGAEAVVHTGNGHQFIYTFVSQYTTSPKDDSLFRYQGSPRLTLQTCTGFWFQNRSLFTFDFKDVR